MKISTQTANLAKSFGHEKAVRIICEAGFDCIDFSFFQKEDGIYDLEKDDFIEKLPKIKKIADSYNVGFNQTHAPFPSYIEGDDEYNKRMYPLIVKSIEASGILGAKYIIVHPTVFSENQKQKNMDFYNSLIPYAKKANVKIAVENMFGWSEELQKLVKNVCSDAEEMCDYLDSLDSRHFVACLDIGHCGIIGENAPDMIRALGHDRLKSLHVHDNDNISDLHNLPFTREIDFAEVVKALKEIDYDGEMTLEADYFLKGFPDGLKVEAAKFMGSVARFLAEM